MASPMDEPDHPACAGFVVPWLADPGLTIWAGYVDWDWLDGGETGESFGAPACDWDLANAPALSLTCWAGPRFGERLPVRDCRISHCARSS